MANKFNNFKVLGPGLLVTVGFIDPGNWATNLTAGASFYHSLIWVVSLSTIMLILLQHNVAHLGIITGYCLSENSSIYLSKNLNRIILTSAFFASISTALAEILGASIALNLLFKIPLKFATFIILITSSILIFFNSYKKIEKIIIGFVVCISLCFIYQLSHFSLDFSSILKHAIIPEIKTENLPIIVAILGAVVMPHNLFLHSEIIQSRNLNTLTAKEKEKLLKYEFLDTIFSMLIGWAINVTIIVLAAEVFYKNNIKITDISQAGELLEPALGSYSKIAFGIALLFAGLSSSITAGMSGGSIFSGIFKQHYNIKNITTKLGIIITLIVSSIIILFISDPFQGLILSQIILSMQLPITIFLQIYLTSSKKVMGKYKNTIWNNIALVCCGLIVSILNLYLLYDIFFN